MNRLIFILLFITTWTFCEVIDDNNKNIVDCLILEDENSIICKYTHERQEEEKEIVVQWIDPSGNLSRERRLIIPPGHGSIYDFRYIEGRQKGLWQFKLQDNNINISTTFKIQ